MLCAISGEAPQVPVASRKSGNVFEKRLIEQYITDHGRDPVTGEDLTIDDLIELKSARTIKPRLPTLTSIPSLLSVLQNEWDAQALETYTLKQHLSQLRQELSTALYNNDAAVRVVGRLTKERDEAREALSRLSVGDRRNGQASAATSNGDAMQVDGVALPDSVIGIIESTHAALSSTRRKRPIPEDWATVEDIEALDARSPAKKLAPPGSRSLAIDKTVDAAIVGSSDGSISIYSLSEQEVTRAFTVDGTVTDVASFEQDGKGLVAVASSSGEVALFQDEAKIASFGEHAGSATAIAVHPSGKILVSVGSDKSFVLYDLVGLKPLTRFFTSSQLECCQFHPDGQFFAAGGKDGEIQVFDTKSVQKIESFTAAGPLQALSFSENGTWLASIIQGSQTASIWDLRKAAEIHSVDFGGKVDCIGWDYTGQYLAGAGPGGVTIQHYAKSTRSWSQPLMKAVPGTALVWGALGKSLVLLSPEGEVNFLT